MNETKIPMAYCWKCDENHEGSEFFSETLVSGEEVLICAFVEVIL